MKTATFCMSRPQAEALVAYIRDEYPALHDRDMRFAAVTVLPTLHCEQGAVVERCAIQVRVGSSIHQYDSVEEVCERFPPREPLA